MSNGEGERAPEVREQVETGKTGKVQVNFLIPKEDRENRDKLSLDNLDELASHAHRYGLIDTPQRSKLLAFMYTLTYNWMREAIKQQHEKGGG